MTSLPVEMHSFVYAHRGSRYSVEIPAQTRTEAEERIAALSAAVWEGLIKPDRVIQPASDL